MIYLGNWLDTLQTGLINDLMHFAPELVLCFAIVLLLFLRLFSGLNRLHLGSIALGFTLLALGLNWKLWDLGDRAEAMFTGLLAYDNLTLYIRLFLLAFTALVIWLTILTGIPDRETSADFYVLLLGAIVGMSLMASANHLLMVFIGVEMASLPSYALAGFLKRKRQSSEAALKYVVYGGGASGIMLYGISLLVGKFGTGYLPDLAQGFSAALRSHAGVDPILVLGTLFILVGFGFKISAVPFHFWCPDVFEGAAAEVAGFLSVASKGAALALLGRFALVLAGLGSLTPQGLASVGAGADHATVLKMAEYLGTAIGVFAAITATFGNLAAYLQTNLKRLLAYSTIAHAGYMLMGLATFTKEGFSAVLFYLGAYLFMNLGAFAVVAFLRNQTGSEELSSYRGLMQRAPVMAVTLGVFLFSLLGIPPLVGFAAKFQIFWALFDAGKMYGREGAAGLSTTMYALLVIGAVNTVISLVYYIKVLKVMALDSPVAEGDGRPLPRLHLPWASALYSCLMAGAVLLLGIWPDWYPLADYSQRGVSQFVAQPEAVVRQLPAGRPRAGG
jgi:NADH-quinone oxidoreductase subunit N